VDASFDVMLSTFGVMFCPNQEKAAGELLRVCRSGGKIGLANWALDGFIGNMLCTLGKHVPPHPGIKPPPMWGTEERLRELLGEGVSSLDTTRRRYVFEHPSAESEYFRAYYGPTRRAFEALDPPGRDALARDLKELLEDWNMSGGETLVVASDYLEVVEAGMASSQAARSMGWQGRPGFPPPWGRRARDAPSVPEGVSRRRAFRAAPFLRPARGGPLPP